MSYKVILDSGCQGEVKPSAYLFAVAACIYSGVFLFTKIKNVLVETEQKYIKDHEQEEQEIIDTSDIDTQSKILDYYTKIHYDDLPKKLNERMQFYELYSSAYIKKLDHYTDFVIKLNGSNFSNLFSNLKSNEFFNLKTPYLNDIKCAIDYTTADLVKEFNAATGFNQSDEIILMFKSIHSNTYDEINSTDVFDYNQLFKNNVNKILNIISSFASVRFQKYLRNFNEEKYGSICDNITFNSNLIIFPNDNEIANYFLWKSQYVCYNNFVNEIYNSYFDCDYTCTNSNKDIKTTKYKVHRLKEEHKLDISDFNMYLQYGTFIKRQFETFVEEDITYWRNAYVRFTLPKFVCSQSYIDLLKCKNFSVNDFNDIDYELKLYI